jgi:hypothetical protein
MAAEFEQQDVEKRCSPDRQQWLWRLRRQRAEPAPDAAAQDHRLPNHLHPPCREPRRSTAGKQALLDEPADNVPSGYVDLLDQRRQIRGCMQAEIAA